MEAIQQIPEPKKKSSNRNRNAGHGYEREVVKELREIGYPAASTSRLESRSRDNQKIDICNKDEDVHGRIPYNIQCKCVVGSLNYRKYLGELPQGKEINVVFHKSTKKTEGGIFRTTGQYAILSKADFYSMVREINELKDKLKNYEQ